MQKEGTSAGRITSGIESNTLVMKTIAFIYTQLPAWRDDPDRQPEISEPKLNPQLCKFLNFHANSQFPMVSFFHEEPQAPNRSVDISVLPRVEPHSKYDPLLVIECKRLPAPDMKREKEYVSGLDPHKISGGIQRFKLGLHSGNISPAVMVGYIQEKDASFWLEQINSWICEFAKQPIGDRCVWADDEILQFLEACPCRGISTYVSNHRRISSSILEICHLWVNMARKD